MDKFARPSGISGCGVAQPILAFDRIHGLDFECDETVRLAFRLFKLCELLRREPGLLHEVQKRDGPVDRARLLFTRSHEIPINPVVVAWARLRPIPNSDDVVVLLLVDRIACDDVCSGKSGKVI